VHNRRFDEGAMVLICIYALQLGLQTDYMARNITEQQTPELFRIVEITFLSCFTLELTLRLFVYRMMFFKMWGWAWNVLDLITVLLQLLEEAMVQIIDYDEFSPGFVPRIVRVLRLMRVARLLRLARFMEELRLLVNCIVHSVKAFFWSTLMLLLMIYVLSIYFTQIVTIARREGTLGHVSENLANRYGSVPRSSLSLFQGLTGGVDWDELSTPLFQHVSSAAGALFLAYVTFGIIAGMNIITGTFVNNALERADEVKEIHKVDQARKLFQSLDIDLSGCITFDEIASQLESADVRDFFSAIDVDVSEARCLFEVLDIDNSGSIGFEEFLSGCLRLQGPAKVIDLMLILKENKDFCQEEVRNLRELKQQMREFSANITEEREHLS